MRRPWSLALLLTAGLTPIGTLEAQVVYSDLRTRMGCAEYSNESQAAYDARCDEEEAAARKASGERYADMVATQRAVAALRKKLDKEPALPASKNPLLGRWRRERSAAADKNDFIGQINSMVTGVGCDVLVGDGELEFRANTWVNFDSDGELSLGSVTYRSGTLEGMKVVYVLPEKGVVLLPLGFHSADRIQMVGIANPCILQRVKPGAASKPSATPSAAAKPATAPPTAASPAAAPPVVVKPRAPQPPLPGAGFKIAGVTLGVDDVPAVAREVKSRGGGLWPASSIEAPDVARAYGRDADYSSFDARVSIATYDFESDEPTARLVAVTFYMPSESTRALFAERAAELIQEFSVEERATDGKLVATLEGGVQLTLQEAPAEYAVKETYALPK